MVKGIRSICLWLTLFSVFGMKAQSTSAFNDSTSVWYVADTKFIGGMGPIFTETRTIQYTLPRDTVINAQAWRTLQSTDQSTGIVTHEGNVTQSGQFGLYYSSGHGLDTLYDYSLGVGDTSLLFNQFNVLTVVSVDSVLVQGSFHKRILFDTIIGTLSSSYTDMWIEGIGSLFGPLAPIIPYAQETDHYSFPDSTRLTCFENSAGVIWSNPNYSNCITTILQSILDLEHVSNSLKIAVSDNPVRSGGIISVQLNNNSALSGKQFTVQLHDQFG